jgi:hypothetical protein
MKNLITLLSLSVFFSTSVFAKIVVDKNLLYIQTSTETVPLSTVNDMIKQNAISNLKMYGNGSAHIISYAVKKDVVKLYSVDEKGFTYAIEPFSSYNVSNTDEEGKFQFNEIPGRKFIVDPKGFFIY